MRDDRKLERPEGGKKRKTPHLLDTYIAYLYVWENEGGGFAGDGVVPLIKIEEHGLDLTVIERLAAWPLCKKSRGNGVRREE